MEQIQHEGGIQGDLAFLPKRVIGMCVLRRGVADEIGDQLQNVCVISDVVEGIVAVGVFRVHEVNDADGIALPQKQRNGGAGQFPLGVSRDIGGVGLVKIGLDHIPGLARAGAAHHDLQEVSLVLPPVEAHAEVLGEDGVVVRVLVPVFPVKLVYVPPAGGAVLLSGSAVLLGGNVQHNGEGIDHQRPQHEFEGVGGPMDGKGAFQHDTETPHEVKDGHTFPIAAGEGRPRPEDGDGQQEPREGAAVLLLHGNLLSIRVSPWDLFFAFHGGIYF